MKVRIAFATLGASATLLGWTLWRAWHVDAVLATAAPPTAGSAIGAGAPLVPAPPPYSVERVLAAVDKDPFHPERRRPGVRFHLPNDVATAIVSHAVADVRVIGTAVAAGGGGFAMCSWAGGQPRIVRLGERVGDWTLSKVTPGAAEFRAPTGTTVVVRIAKAGT